MFPLTCTPNLKFKKKKKRKEDNYAYLLTLCAYIHGNFSFRKYFNASPLTLFFIKELLSPLFSDSIRIETSTFPTNYLVVHSDKTRNTKASNRRFSVTSSSRFICFDLLLYCKISIYLKKSQKHLISCVKQYLWGNPLDTVNLFSKPLQVTV